MKTLILIAVLAGYSIVGFAQLSNESELKLIPIKAFEVVDFKADREPVPQIIARLNKFVSEARLAKGATPMPIVIAPNSVVLQQQPRTFHVQKVDLYTLLEYLTVGAGYQWKIQNKQIVIYTSPEIQARFLRAEKMPGRAQLKAAVIPNIKFNGEPMSTALRMLHQAAQKNGMRVLTPGFPMAQFKIGYDYSSDADYPVRGTFLNTDADTILEMITQQAGVIDWTIKKGNVELVLERSLREAQARNPRVFGSGGTSADPFADPVGPVAAPRRPVRPRLPGRPRINLEKGKIFNTESYDTLTDNPFLSPANEALSTFSIDVDTASYSNVRRFLTEMKSRPPVDAVRIEELVNYFNFDYAQPSVIENPERKNFPVEHPFAANLEVASCPWNTDHRLVRIGLKGYEVPIEDRPPSNLVFLLDVSGSMSAENKLPLLIKAMKLLVRGLNDKDRVAIVVYAGASGEVLKSTLGSKRQTIMQALNRLKSGGGTNAGKGIDLAYKIAQKNHIKNGNNRVILCTDGDFNVGTTDKGSLKKVVSENASQGTQLTILGFGMGNYKDDMLETLSNAGDGNYGYIDSMKEARKLFVERLQGTLLMIAKDVKIQVEFNPRHVNAYRLIGYENRLLNAEDFANDKIDAGDIGAGHTVTAFYEIVPTGVTLPEQPGAIKLKYQEAQLAEGEAANQELLTLKLRYKWPDEDVSHLLETSAIDQGKTFANASRDFKFASAVAGFGMLLRDSPHSGNFSFEKAVAITKANMGTDPFGDRAEFLKLLKLLAW